MTKILHNDTCPICSREVAGYARQAGRAGVALEIDGLDAAPDWGGDPERTNPEQALASALSSCQMMTFLALSAKAGWPVASYHDYAVAHLGKNARGQMSVTRIDLNPVVRFDTGFAVDAETLAEMQDRAHRYCFIANTLSDTVEINVL